MRKTQRQFLNRQKQNERKRVFEAFISTYTHKVQFNDKNLEKRIQNNINIKTI